MAVTPGFQGARPRPTRPLSQRLREWTLTQLCFGAGLVSIITTVGILFVLIKESITFFGEVSFAEFFLGTQWSPMMSPERFGVLPLISGTFQIAIGAALIAVPIGLLIAVYLAEFATPRIRSIAKPALEVLAGVPTVVYGYLGITVITPMMKSWGLPVDTFNALAGAIVVGIMIIPLVSSLSEDAISAVPKSLREAALGLGATRSEVIGTVVLKAASSGIAASVILAISRAVGETMAVTLAAGSTPKMAFNPLESIQTMTAFIANTVGGEARVGSAPYQSMFAVATALFALTFGLNLLSAKIVRNLKRHHG